MTIGERIKLRRMQLGLSQNDLAEMVRTSQQQIGRYEKGANSPTAEIIIAMAQALETTTDWLLGVNDELNPHYDDGNLSYSEHELIKLYRMKPTQMQESIISMVRAI